MTPDVLLRAPFGTLTDLIRAHAAESPSRPAVADDGGVLDYGALDDLVERVAAALQRDGVQPGESGAICASASAPYLTAFLGLLRVGAAAAPLAPSSTPESLIDMIADCGARILFLDAATWAALAPLTDRLPSLRVALDGSDAGVAFEAWLAPPNAQADPVKIGPDDPFNIIYSSGTTGKPKASSSRKACVGCSSSGWSTPPTR